MSPGEEIFWRNARVVLRNIDMQHLDPAHGAAVDVVRWCLLVRGRPTHHRQIFLEKESPPLLAYLEGLATSGDATGWRTLRDRIQYHAELLRDGEIQPCARPWLAAIWHILPEIAAIGQVILDRLAANAPASELASVATGTAGGTGGETGTAGKAGSASKPKSSQRLALPVVAVVLTGAEMEALDHCKEASDADSRNDTTPEGPDGTNGPTGPKMSGSSK